MKVPLEAALQAAAGRYVGTLPMGTEIAFSTDTRTLVSGDAFVALRGERFDGHDYVAQAVAAGAQLVVVSEPDAVPAGMPAIIVNDTTDAYLAFGAVARVRSRARFVAVTGSAGKTTTTAFLAQVLREVQGGRVVATPGNENNAIGVAKLLLAMPDDAAFVVAEFGARHFGEIAPLARAVRPEAAVLTNIGDAHLEIFGTPERLAETKWGIFATGARRIFAAGDRRSVAFARADAEGAESTLFALDEQPAPLPHASSVILYGRDRLAYERDWAKATEPGAGYATDVRVPGDHNRLNAVAAAAAAFALGFSGAGIGAALATLELPPGRYERIDVGDFSLLYDAYNASLAGTLATLKSFAREPASRRIAVLGSMAELGSDSAAMHAEAGAAAANAGLDRLLFGGPYAAELASGARSAGYDAGRILTYEHNAEAIAWLRDNAQTGDLILLKASRRYKLEEVVAGLRGVHAG